MTDCPVYRAERVAWARVAAFRDLVPDAQAFVEFVTTREPFLSLREKAGLPQEYVTVTYGPVQLTHIALARIEEQHIDLPQGYAPQQGLLLHEIAHLCTPADAHHDYRFAANYVTLVRHWLGTFAAEELLRELRYHRAMP